MDERGRDPPAERAPPLANHASQASQASQASHASHASQARG
jgi:hypothetical protein